MNENRRELKQINEVPQEYEQLLIQCVPNTPNYLVRCRHPNGSYLDYHVKLDGRIAEGECPTCGSRMSRNDVGYVCSNNHIPVIMAVRKVRMTSNFARPKIRTKIESPKHIGNNVFVPRTNKAKTEVVDVSFEDIKDKVAKAMGDVLESL